MVPKATPEELDPLEALCEAHTITPQTMLGQRVSAYNCLVGSSGNTINPSIVANRCRHTETQAGNGEGSRWVVKP